MEPFAGRQVQAVIGAEAVATQETLTPLRAGCSQSDSPGNHNAAFGDVDDLEWLSARVVQV
ncbi:MAG: hypothetical protein AB1772_09150 [Candidatus Zixiibacteriota bacterium]